MKQLSKAVALSLVLVGFGAGSAATALGQQPVAQAPTFQSNMSRSTLMWPQQDWGSAGSFTSTAVGEFTGDGTLDVVTLAGSTPVLLWNPAIYGLQHQLPGAANDMDVIPAGGPHGRDALGLVGPNGLSAVQLLDGNTADFVELNIAQGVWLGALRLSCGDVDIGGRPDFVGLLADHHSIAWRRAETGQEVVLYSSELVVDVGLAQWDADASLELVVLRATGLSVFDLMDNSVPPVVLQVPASIASYTHDTSLVMCVVPPSPQVTGDTARVAVVTSTPTSRQLAIYGMGMATQTLSLPASMTFVGMTAGDADADHDFDLMLSQRRQFGPLYVENMGPESATFQIASPVSAGFVSGESVLTTVAYAAQNAATPVFADFTDDGRADLVIPLQQTGDSPGHIFLRNTSTSQQQAQVSGTPAFFQGGRLFYDSDTGWVDGLVVFANDAAPFTNPTNPPNAVRVTVWRQANGDEVPMPAGAVYDMVEPMGALPLGTVTVRVQFEPANACFDGGNQLFWLQVQPLRITPESGGDYSIAHTWLPKVGFISANAMDLCHYMTETPVGGIAMDLDAPEDDIDNYWSNGWPTAWPNGVALPDGTFYGDFQPICGDYISCTDTGVVYGPPPGVYYAGNTHLPAISGRHRFPQFATNATPEETLVTQPPQGLGVFFWMLQP